MRCVTVIIIKDGIANRYDYERNIVDKLTISSIMDGDGFLQRGTRQALPFRLPSTPMNAMQHSNAEQLDSIADNDGGLYDYIIEVNGVPVFEGKGKRTKSTSGKESHYYHEAWTAANWVGKASVTPLTEVVPEPFAWSVADIDNVMSATAFSNPFDVGFDRVYYPVVYNANIDGYWFYESMLPHLPILTLIENFFCACGYTIKSEFLYSDFFKRLTIPFGWGRFGNTDQHYQDNTNFRADDVDSFGQYMTDPSFVGSQALYYADTQLVMTNDSLGLSFDDANAYDPSNGIITPSQTGFYTFSANIRFNSVAVEQDNEAGPPFFYLALCVNEGTAQEVRYRLDGSLSQGLNGEADSLRFGVIPEIGSQFGETYYAFDAIIINMQQSQEIFLTGGDSVTIKLVCDQPSNNNGAVTGVFMNTSVVPYSSYGMQRVPKYVLGEVVDWAEIIDPNITALNLWQALKSRFNLHSEPNECKGIICIEPKFAWRENTGENGNGFIQEAFNINGENAAAPQPINLDAKVNLSEVNTLQDFDNMQRILQLCDASDSKDGFLTMLEKQYKTKLSNASYQFTERFKDGTKKQCGELFAPTTHTLINASMFPVMVRDVEAEISDGYIGTDTDFTNLKILYYEGQVNGQWRFAGGVLDSYPKAYFVNWVDVTGNSPNLGYATQTLRGIKVDGLLEKYFHRDLFMMKGRYWNTLSVDFNIIDMLNLTHRTPVAAKGNTFYLSAAKGFNVAEQCPTKLVLRKLDYPNEADCDNITNDNTVGLITLPVAECFSELQKVDCFIATDTQTGGDAVCVAFEIIGNSGDAYLQQEGSSGTILPNANGEYVACTPLPYCDVTPILEVFDGNEWIVGGEACSAISCITDNRGYCNFTRDTTNEQTLFNVQLLVAQATSDIIALEMSTAQSLVAFSLIQSCIANPLATFVHLRFGSPFLDLPLYIAAISSVTNNVATPTTNRIEITYDTELLAATGACAEDINALIAYTKEVVNNFVAGGYGSLSLGSCINYDATPSALSAEAISPSPTVSYDVIQSNMIYVAPIKTPIAFKAMIDSCVGQLVHLRTTVGTGVKDMYLYKAAISSILFSDEDLGIVYDDTVRDVSVCADIINPLLDITSASLADLNSSQIWSSFELVGCLNVISPNPVINWRATICQQLVSFTLDVTDTSDACNNYILYRNGVQLGGFIGGVPVSNVTGLSVELDIISCDVILQGGGQVLCVEAVLTGDVNPAVQPMILNLVSCLNDGEAIKKQYTVTVGDYNDPCETVGIVRAVSTIPQSETLYPSEE